MPVFSINNVRIAGLAAAVPPLEELSWDELELAPAQSVNARKRNATPCRRMAKREQCQSDFCAEAAKKLMAELDWQFGEIDAVVMATVTPDYPIPPTAIILQDRLGVPKTAVAFDLPSGAIGFLHGLQVAASLISTGCLKKALLFAGHVGKSLESSAFDQPHRLIYGDNGSVCALEHLENSPAMVFDSGGDGAAFQSHYMPVGGHRVPVAPSMFADAESSRAANDFVFDRKTTDAVALRELPGSVRRVLEAAGKSMADLDGCYFNPLQPPAEASLRKELGIPSDMLHSVVNDLDGGDSGSIPLAMIAGGASRLRAGPRVSLLGGTGTGIAWGSALITTDCIVCPDIIEL